MTEKISDIELQAYIDDELDIPRRIAIESYLETRPEIAASVMRDMRLRDELRLFLSEDEEAPPARTLKLMGRVANRRRLHSLGPIFRHSAAVAILLATGWLAHDYVTESVPGNGAAPGQLLALIDEAAEAHQAALIELSSATPLMAGEPRLLAERILDPDGSAALTLPAVESLLDLIGSELVPWDGGVAVQIVYRDRQGRNITLFAARADSNEVQPPTAAVLDGFTLVYWQDGPYAFALSGDVPAEDLLGLAPNFREPARS